MSVVSIILEKSLEILRTSQRPRGTHRSFNGPLVCPTRKRGFPSHERSGADQDARIPREYLSRVTERLNAGLPNVAAILWAHLNLKENDRFNRSQVSPFFHIRKPYIVNFMAISIR